MWTVNVTLFGLHIFIIHIFIKCIASHNLNSEDNPDFLLCRECGADTADSSYLYNIFSPLALVQSNQSLFGRHSVPVQFLENPLGIRFRVVTLSKASCTGVDQWQSDFSWFPGYAWKFCLCTHCGHHLGWLFEPLKSANEDQRTVSKNGFYAIILDNVLSESFSDSLMIVPKSYKS